ncbi:MAG: hypothetical protein ACRENU_02230 [Gemmatimonadaceae bacterium]
MAQPAITASVLQLVGSVLLIAALIPSLRGGTVNVAFLAPATLFIILGLIVAIRNRRRGSTPPAA